MADAMLGVIGGSGLYEFPDLEEVRTRDVATPYGQPSAPITLGRLAGTAVAFLPRHGIGHRLSPSDVPYRANVYAMKALGVTHLVSLSAVGSLQETVAPLDLVLPDQIVDRTVARPRSFFGDGVVAHVGLAQPFCPSLRAALREAAAPTGRMLHETGTYVCIEGPQFSTRAESEIYRSWGVAVIGMTAMPEARLAREAELCYAVVAMVTDYDVWHESAEQVSVELVVANLRANVAAGRELVRRLVGAGLPPCDAGCSEALRDAIITDPAVISPAARRRLGLIADKYLPPSPDLA